VVDHREDPDVASLIEDVRHEVGDPQLSLADSIAQLRHWIAADKKVTPLKALQGLMWEEGYQRGDFTGHLYEDAARNLRAWHARGLKLYVYSSGSVHAQKLLFGYSDFGDLTPLFSGYFDTQVGHKRETVSYQRIVAEIGLPAAEILFLSDIAEELDAAQRAGLQTYCLIRENQSTDGLAHRWANTFDSIALA
jgi:enolase-phosphatase E1